MVIFKGIEENHLKISSLTHHPEVGRHREVHQDQVEQATPDRVLRPNSGVIEYSVAPQEPEDVTEDEAEEHVYVDSHSTAQEGLVTDEDSDGQEEEEKG